MVKDIRPDTTDLSVSEMTSFNGVLYFTVYGDPTYGEELWRSDGTDAGTFVVKDINPGTGSSSPRSLTVMNGILYFTASSGGNRDELWRTDGTSDGTYLVKQLYSNSYDRIGRPPLVNANGTLFTVSYGNGNQLWKSDGTPAGTIDIATIGQADPTSSTLTGYWMTAVGNGVFFAANDSTAGIELWHSDGTTAGTGRCRHRPRKHSAKPANLIGASTGLYFTPTTTRTDAKSGIATEPCLARRWSRTLTPSQRMRTPMASRRSTGRSSSPPTTAARPRVVENRRHSRRHRPGQGHQPGSWLGGQRLYLLGRICSGGDERCALFRGR